MAMISVGIPAYLAVVGISVRDIVASNTMAMAAIAIAAIVLFSVVFLWLAFLSRRGEDERRIIAALVVLSTLATGIALLGGKSSAYFIVVGAMATTFRRSSTSWTPGTAPRRLRPRSRRGGFEPAAIA